MQKMTLILFSLHPFWQSHESPRPEQIYDSVRHTLKSLGLADHQYVSAVHTDTDNLHVHVAVNRVHPETGYLNRLSWSQENSVVPAVSLN